MQIITNGHERSIHKSKIRLEKDKPYILDEQLKEHQHYESEQESEYDEYIPMVWEETQCGSDHCKKPKGKGRRGKLFWIDCDKCKTWYHKNCENLKVDETRMQTYI